MRNKRLKGGGNLVYLVSSDGFIVCGNKKAFLKEKGLKCSLYGLVNQDSYYLYAEVFLLLISASLFRRYFIAKQFHHCNNFNRV